MVSIDSRSRSVIGARHIAVLLGVFALVILTLYTSLAAPPGNEHFQRTWQRTDQPVLDGLVSRTWMWGPEATTDLLNEPYAEAPGNTRTVQYFDKARMEITNPNADSSSIWYVTNGLLVVELISGQLQTGDATFETRQAAQVNVAGDFDDPTGPTYATFAALLDAPPAALGTTITARVDRQATVTDDPSLAGQGVTVGYPDEVTSHGIAAPFWEFMNSSGPVHEEDQTITAPLFENPYFATGRPITEAYWASVKVAGSYRDVLMQCFERRCLTYTPGNPDGFVVEAGNVGQHYYAWRYADQPGEGTPTATATATTPPTATATATASPTATQTPVTEYEFTSQWGTVYTEIGRFSQPTNVGIDGDNHAWVVDTYNDRLVELDEHGVFIRTLGSTGTQPGQFKAPVDAAFSADGRLYVVNQGTDSIEVFSPEGNFLTRWGSLGTGDGQFDKPTGVVVLGQVVYVVDYLNGRVQYFDLAGTYLGQFGSGLFEDPAQLAIAPDGLIYVTDFKKHVVWKLNADGSYNSQIGGEGAGNGQFTNPSGVAIDADGYIYVVDHGNNRIQKFNPDGSYSTQWGSEGSGFGQFFVPRGLVLDRDGHLYVADYGNSRILKLTTDGAFLFEVYDGRRGQFGNITDIALDQTGNLLTVDRNKYVYDGGTVARYTPDGIPLDALNRTRPETSQYDALTGVAVNPVSGEIYVTDSFTDRIQRFSSTWQYLGPLGSPGTGPGQFNGPTAIAIDQDGNVYVVDADNNRVQKFDPTGIHLELWGGVRDADGQFNQPSGIVVDGERVYVSDFGNDRIQVFDREGTYLDQWGTSGTEPGELDGPVGIVVSPEGTVLVVDSGNDRVQAFTPEGEALTAFGSSGNGPGQFELPWGIEVDADGNVYVTDLLSYRVQVFSPTG